MCREEGDKKTGRPEQVRPQSLGRVTEALFPGYPGVITALFLISVALDTGQVTAVAFFKLAGLLVLVALTLLGQAAHLLQL